MITKYISAALIFLFVQSAHADELFMSREEALINGYLPIENSGRSNDFACHALPWEKHSLKWPLKFRNDADPVGNDMVQFQDYGAPYYHGGQDLVSRAGEKLVAPINGRLEGGHYSYTRNANGSKTKNWIPWPGKGSPNYFELAVVTAEGYRFEFHHVDRANLPGSTVEALNKGGAQVEAGAHIGNVIKWNEEEDYDHIHYNIVEPGGLLFVNAEYTSAVFPDSIKPEIIKVFAMNGKTPVVYTGGPLSFHPTEFVIATKDSRFEGGYEHPPAKVIVEFANGSHSGWDFTQTLATADCGWPHIWDFYQHTLTDPDGLLWETWGVYGKGQFLIRVPVPANAKSPFKISVSDMNGNTSTR
jgi:hypothetical protein